MFVLDGGVIDPHQAPICTDCYTPNAKRVAYAKRVTERYLAEHAAKSKAITGYDILEQMRRVS